MLCKLALRNVRRQVGNYLIYFMTVSFTVAMLFAVSNIIFSENLKRYTLMENDGKYALMGVVLLISFVVAFVLSYATSFLLKLRKREFGMYLTLGMTRKNILAVFLTENAILGILSLAAGLAVGLFFYQGLMALMMRLLEMQFALAPYTPGGVILTVVMVAGIFLLASVTSALYLKRARIYDLLHTAKHKRDVRHPLLWLLVTLACLAGIISGLWFIGAEAERNVLNGEPFDAVLNAVLVMGLLIILFHIGLARSLIYALLKRKRMCSRGANTFVLRSLSGALGSNSMMLGCLAFLLAFAVVLVNFSFWQKAGQEAELDRSYPYDIWYTGEAYFRTGIPASEAEEIIGAYGEIESRYTYRLYRPKEDVFRQKTRWSDYEGMADTYMKLSDFNRLIEPLGYEEVELMGEYLLVSNIPEAGTEDWAGITLHHRGKSYALKEVRTDYPVFTYQYFYVVAPDEVVEDLEEEMYYTVYSLKEGDLDAAALLEELSYPDPMGDGMVCDYKLREYGRQELHSVNAFLVIAALFAAAVFLFLAMAILALKTLVGLLEDRPGYEILFRLGMGERQQGRTLFRQTFGFFLLPFVMPLLLSIPSAWVILRIARASRMEGLVSRVPVMTGATALVVTLVYLLYYVAVYALAKRAVVCREGRK